MLDLRLFTPLCPAGHPPHKGGDYHVMDGGYQSQLSKSKQYGACRLISPLVGGMPGRAEGGVIVNARRKDLLA
ncbi:lytic murein transglycosylase [Phyllobacterium salinisoli]|uniref:Lytic murein transglycosylase n=1 Tax=Phyllobacterium salinisoli TaxID=1899321 RepID=A0A368K960_9HYPH|nr:lytic murein transglycosylase [Phyllobacterium salinisoli]